MTEPGRVTIEAGLSSAKVSAWLCHASCQAPARHVDDVAVALRGAGVDVALKRGGPASELGVLLFDRCGPAVLEALRELGRDGCTRVIAVATERCALLPDAAWTLLSAGAADVVVWDAAAAHSIAARLARYQAVERLVRSPLVREHLVGESPAWLAFLRQVVEVAAFSDASVLLLGESGTGKELVARLLHTLDARPQKRELVVLDCTTVVPELSGSEFFGHERGAFTGAVAARDGAFALAHLGTLFLDEVGELPPALQAQLLRAVQEHTYKRVGGNTWQRTEFRLVCATNRDLSDEVARGAFRRDFYYRIASCVCRPPPLRERREDILPLARHFLREMRPGAPALDFDGPVSEYLLRRDYPGNVRDLRQLVAQIARRHVGAGPITVGNLPLEERPAPGASQSWQDGAFNDAVRQAVSLGVGLQEIGRLARETAIRVALSSEEGNLQRAAKRLGVTDRALQMRRAQEVNLASAATAAEK